MDRRNKNGTTAHIAPARARTWVAMTAIVIAIAGCQASPDQSPKAVDTPSIQQTDPRLVNLAELAVRDGRQEEARRWAAVVRQYWAGGQAEKQPMVDDALARLERILPRQ